MSFYQLSNKGQGFLYLAFGIIFISVCLFSFGKDFVFVHTATKIHGIVKENILLNKGKHPYKVTVNFTNPNSENLNYSFYVDQPRTIGSVFDIYYNTISQNACQADILKDTYKSSVLLVVLGCILLSLGWVKINNPEKYYWFDSPR